MTHVKVPDAGGALISFIDVGNYYIPASLKSTPESKAIFDNIPNFKCRDDDIMLCSYPKTGSNWIHEIVMMVLKGSAERNQSQKGQTMMEFFTEEEINSMPLPRVINSHIALRYLPKDLKMKQIKTIMSVRNPKDIAVSYYNHMKGFKTYEYDGKWNDWLPIYMNGKYEYGKYSDYLLEWEEAITSPEGLGFPLHVIYYEDLLMNGFEELERLLKFLNINLNDSLKKKILDMNVFEKMSNSMFPEEVTVDELKPGFNFFRKGKIGDWKNWFTVAQNEQFNRIWNEEMKQSKMFQSFIYE